MENDRADALSRRTNYFNKKEWVKYLILKIKKNGNLMYNHMVLAATFWVKNDVFAE